MNRWITGFLIGLGVCIVGGVLVLLLGGEKPRRFLQERYQQVWGALPEHEHIQQAATRVSQFAGNAKGTAQQAMKKVRHTGE